MSNAHPPLEGPHSFCTRRALDKVLYIWSFVLDAEGKATHELNLADGFLEGIFIDFFLKKITLVNLWFKSHLSLILLVDLEIQTRNFQPIVSGFIVRMYVAQLV